MKPLPNNLCGVIDRMLHGTFPNDSHAPAKCTEYCCMAPVALDVSLKFFSPELFIGLGCGCVAAPLVSMPEAAVHEYHRPVFSERKVGGSG